MSTAIRQLNARSVRMIDVAVLVWVALWAALGLVVWRDIRTQATLSDSVVRVGSAVKETGDALVVLGALPLVGSGVQDLAGRVRQAGADVLDSGRQSADAVHRTAAIAGVAAAVLPATMVLLLYAPLRLTWRRDVVALGAALGRDGPAFEEYLARRAIGTLSWTRLRAVTEDPWGDVAAGRCRALADAELERVGLRRPA